MGTGQSMHLLCTVHVWLAPSSWGAMTRPKICLVNCCGHAVVCPANSKHAITSPAMPSSLGPVAIGVDRAVASPASAAANASARPYQPGSRPGTGSLMKSCSCMLSRMSSAVTMLRHGVGASEHPGAGIGAAVALAMTRVHVAAPPCRTARTQA